MPGTIIKTVLKNSGTIGLRFPEKEEIILHRFIHSCMLSSQIPNSSIQNENREI